LNHKQIAQQNTNKDHKQTQAFKDKFWSKDLPHEEMSTVDCCSKHACERLKHTKGQNYYGEMAEKDYFGEFLL
jgi:hypothetical protein